MVYIIANPVSGAGNGDVCRKKAQQVLSQSGIEHRVLMSEYPGHSTLLAQQACADPECSKVIVIGGDGTFSEVVSGMNLEIPMAFVPAGTGNDFVKGCGLAENVDEAIAAALSDEYKSCDILNVNGNRCLNIAGTGFDVNVLLGEKKIRKILPGKISYKISLLLNLLALRFTPISIGSDGGEVRELKVLLVAAANGKYYGGGMPISLDASCEDGYIDLVIIKKLPRIKIPYIFIKFFAGKLKEVTKHVEVHRCKAVHMDVKNRIPVNVDGELLDELPACVEISPGAMKVICPTAKLSATAREEKELVKQ